MIKPQISSISFTIFDIVACRGKISIVANLYFIFQNIISSSVWSQAHPLSIAQFQPADKLTFYHFNASYALNM